MSKVCLFQCVLFSILNGFITWQWLDSNCKATSVEKGYAMATIPRYVSLRDLPVFLFLGLLLLLDLWLCLLFFDLLTFLSLWRPARGAGVISVTILLLLIVLLGIPATRETPSMTHMLGPTCDAKNHGWLIYWCPDLGFVCSGFRTPQVYATVCCNTIELWEILALSTFFK